MSAMSSRVVCALVMSVEVRFTEADSEEECDLSRNSQESEEG